jgi:isoleucyl-tRNA synthetase
MKRVSEVIDCWFDSGSMPFAQHHYPFENKEIFEQQFPADFISEAVDQTRGWFYSLLAISTLIFDKAPFKNVIVLGLVQDENGQKMSKSKGNAVDPFDALAKFGADAIRWYFYTNSAPWLPNKFHDKVVIEGQRKFMGTFWNTYAFYVLYAEIDKFDPTKYKIEYDKLSVMDKWLLSKMNSMVKAADDNLANYRIPEAAKAMQDFVDDLSNWYVRRGRERYWAVGMSQDKINAYMTLYTALVTLAKCAAPMVPFITEEIYQNLVRSVDAAAPESIHLCDYPTADESMIDLQLEADMEEVLDIVVLGRSARNGASLKNRQPLSVMYVSADHELGGYYADIIRDELNLKDVQFTNDVSAYIDYKFKPQLKTLGPKYGRYLNEIRTLLSELDGHAAMDELNSTGSLKLSISTGEIALSKEDVLIESEQKDGFYTLTDSGVTVAISTVLTPELIEEGFVREVISKVQTMRKDSGFEVMDHIIVSVSGSEKVLSVIEKNKAAISHDVLAEDIRACESENAKAWDINGEKVAIGVEKV